ncbi:glycoside hydrolase family 78 protein [Draconibacterium sp.]|nr:glycoside hydrolase family 78 protein [Draconibacterium sp.]
MNRLNFILLVLFCAGLQACSIKKQHGLTFDKMLVEYAECPIDLDMANPRFSWIVTSKERGQVQTGYRILLASSKELLAKNKGDLWDTGKQISGKTIHHEYNKGALKSNQKYFWKVIIRNKAGIEIESPVASFETAILDANEWKSDWIGNGPVTETLPVKGFYGHRKEQADMSDTVVHNGNSLILRNEVALFKKIKSAKAYISGLGFYEFYINGHRVGDHVLAPAKSPYHKHILYDTYDVTALLQKGENALGIHLGNGWYNPYKPWWQQYRMQWFGSKKAMAQIHITYNDGTSEIISTNKDWKWANGPIVYNCIYDGEVYDANLEIAGWKQPDFDDSDWNAVHVIDSPKARLLSHRMPGIKVVETIQPKEINVDIPGMKVFDMEQNFTGWVRIKVRGKKNTKVKIRFAEDRYEDGTIDRSSAEHAKATAEYILKGEGEEVYEPSFTYFGFRYVELVSETADFELLDINGQVVYTNNAKAGNFECSNTLVNKIHRATVWSQKSNMLGYPMDCPQRDERLGWFGDAQVTAEEAMFNFDMALFYDNWFEGIKDNQDEKTGDIPIISPQPYFWDEGVEWSSTYILMLWQYYTYYGDSRILEKHYPAMKRYMEFLESISEDRILPKGWIGDWGSMTEGWKEGNPKSIPTAFYYFNARILSKIANVIHKESDVKIYTKLAEDIAIAYNKNYLNVETGNYLDGTQMDNAFPLFLGLVPDDVQLNVLANLVKDIVETNGTHLTTGVLGTKYMPEALAQFGRSDVAWDIINQKTYPSWNDMMSKYTTTCEFWTLKQSKNHVMMGSIDAWFYKYITGIQLDKNNPAYSVFTVKPTILKGLEFANAELETIKGTVSSSWKKEAGELTLNVTVPFNTTANVFVPGNKDAECYENGVSVKNIEGVEYIGYSNGVHQLKVQSGSYSFIAVLK